jgi:hypothetical protein
MQLTVTGWVAALPQSAVAVKVQRLLMRPSTIYVYAGFRSETSAGLSVNSEVH